jgi:hypothetical protein
MQDIVSYNESRLDGIEDLALSEAAVCDGILWAKVHLMV